jgi:DNA-binding beta-propeller fold protein YncE
MGLKLRLSTMLPSPRAAHASGEPLDQGTAERRSALAWRPVAIAAALVLLLSLSAALAYRALSQSALSEIALGQQVSDSPMIVDTHSGHLFVASTTTPGLPECWITMVDLSSGKVLLRVPVGIGEPQLTLDSRLDRVIVAGTYSSPEYRQRGYQRPDAHYLARMVIALDGRTGAVVQTAQMAGATSSLDEDVQLGHLFIAGGGGDGVDCNICPDEPSVVTMLDAVTLKTLAVVPVGDTPRSIMVDQRNARAYVTTNAGIYVLDARTGAQIAWLPPGHGGSVLAIDNRTNRVLIAADGAAVALNGRTGQVAATLRSVAPADVSYFGDTIVLVSPRTGHLYYIDVTRSGQAGATGRSDLMEADGTTGRILKDCPITATSPAFTLLPAHDRVAVTNMAMDMQSNTVQVEDMATCTVIQVQTLSRAPVNIAADEASGRLIVEANEIPVARDRWGWVPSWLRSRVPFVPQKSTVRTATAAAVDGTLELITLQK